MKIRNNAKNGTLICISILVIGLLILLAVNNIKTVDVNTLNTTDKAMYDLGAYKGETSTWKIICYIILGLLFILSIIINLVMCRCHYCGKHINSINRFMIYCPYCSKSLNKTKKEVLNEINSKKE